MVRRKRSYDLNDVIEFFNQLLVEKPFLPFAIPLVLVFWSIEKWVFSLSNWVPLAVAVWATIQYGNYQQRNVVEDLNKKWNQIVLQTSPVTPLEHCEWLNKLLIEVWPNYISPKLSIRFSSIVEKRLKHRKSRLIERIELQSFSLGSCPPILGLHGTRWTTSGDQSIMRLGFDWDTTDMSILLLAKLAKPLMGTARIVVNSIHIKGDAAFSGSLCESLCYSDSPFLVEYPCQHDTGTGAGFVWDSATEIRIRLFGKKKKRCERRKKSSLSRRKSRKKKSSLSRRRKKRGVRRPGKHGPSPRAGLPATGPGCSFLAQENAGHFGPARDFFSF